MSRVDTTAAFAPRIGDNSNASGRNRNDSVQDGPSFAEFLPRSPGASGSQVPARAASAGPGFREDAIYAGADGVRGAEADSYSSSESGFVDDISYASEAGGAEAKSRTNSPGTVKLEESGFDPETGDPETGEAATAASSTPTQGAGAPNAGPTANPVGGVFGQSAGATAQNLIAQTLIAQTGLSLTAAQLLAAEAPAGDGAGPESSGAPEQPAELSPASALLALAFLQTGTPASRTPGGSAGLAAGGGAAKPGPAGPETRAAPSTEPGSGGGAEPLQAPLPNPLANPGANPLPGEISLEGFTPVTDGPREDNSLLSGLDPAATTRGGAGAEAARDAAGATSQPRINVDSLAGLAARIAKRHEAGNSVFDLRLDPAELGRISVRIEIDADNRAQAVIAAERPEALAELTRNARALETSLRQSGLTLGDDGLRFELAGQDPNANPGAGQGFPGDADSRGAAGAANRGRAGNDFQFSGPDEGLKAAVRRVISGRLDLVA